MIPPKHRKNDIQRLGINAHGNKLHMALSICLSFEFYRCEQKSPTLLTSECRRVSATQVEYKNSQHAPCIAPLLPILPHRLAWLRCLEGEPQLPKGVCKPPCRGKQLRGGGFTQCQVQHTSSTRHWLVQTCANYIQSDNFRKKMMINHQIWRNSRNYRQKISLPNESIIFPSCSIIFHEVLSFFRQITHQNCNPPDNLKALLMALCSSRWKTPETALLHPPRSPGFVTLGKEPTSFK